MKKKKQIASFKANILQQKSIFGRSINASIRLFFSKKVTERNQNMRHNIDSAILLHFKEKKYQDVLKEKIGQDKRLSCRNNDMDKL